MRFTKQRELREKYMNGERKLVQKFLWFPLTIDGETRWLETAEILYKVKKGEDIFCKAYYYWAPMKFINE